MRLRSEVFVVEQNCIYQDIDGKDEKAIHVLGVNEGKFVAYTRMFKSGDYFETASIGRVVVEKRQREYGWGKEIMKASIAYVLENLRETTIELSAQRYLTKFYNELDFHERGEEYLEDGIPHIRMVYQAKY